MDLICPLCHTLSPPNTVNLWALRRSNNHLRCSNPSCPGRYPLQPYPIIIREPGRVVAHFAELPDFGSLSVTGRVLSTLPEDSTLLAVLRKRSTYLWAHYHDLLPEDYRPDFVHPAPFTQRALDLLSEVKLPEHPRALVAGCGPGREALELAARLRRSGADDARVVACDIDPALLSCLDTLRREGSLEALLRGSVDLWRSPEPIVLGAPLREAAEDVELVCADILDPPFPPGSFDLIVALNLLDNVTDPLALLNQLNLQLRPGGLLLLSSPFAWHERITPRDKRLAFAVPHARMEDRMLLEKLLTGAIPLGYGPPMTFRSLATDRLTWHLRVHDTHYQTYLPPLALWRKDG
ncbi:MAG: hypothetical protein CMH57_07965 [Myxococcales bacterium]|nr:hypothetical protein [Myxococcales bacterium]